MIKIITLIKNNLPMLLIALSLSALVASVTWLAAWNTGWRSGSGLLANVQRDNRDLVMQVTSYERAARAVAEQNAQLLAEALERQTQEYKRADAVTAELRIVQRQLETARKQQKQRINDAVKNDSATFSGIGPDSLRTYRASLGYTTDNQHMSKNSVAAAGNPAEATRTADGLPPADLLSHAADYGAWCQTINKQLEAIRTWQQGGQ